MHKNETVHWYFRAKYSIVLSILDRLNLQGANLIDFGCGCGRMMQLLSHYGTVTGVDMSGEAIGYCREIGVQGTLVQCSIERLSFEGVYDAAVALDVLEHIEDDARAAKNVFRALKPGASCIFTVPAFQSLWSEHDENLMHRRRYYRQGLILVLESAGFSIEYCSYINFWLFIPIFLVRFFCRLLGVNRSAALENSLPAKPLNSLLYHLFSSERGFIRRKLRLPFGISIIALCTRSR